MVKGKLAALERVNGRENEYIVKDNAGITAGRVYIIEHLKENRSCMLRFKFYREDSYSLLKDALMVLLRTLFKNREIHKVNLLIDEQINTRAFVDLGFVMEGILEDNIIVNGAFRSELVFGIDSKSFENNSRTSILRLQGKRVEVKVLTLVDSEDILDYYSRNKKHLREFEPAREDSFYTLKTQRRILSESYKQFLNGSSINCGIYKDGRLIGKLQVSNIVYGVFRNAFVGYSIDEKEQGKGYMKEALGLMLDYAFEDMELHRLEASTLLDNEKSQRVLLSCGFKELGVNQEYLFINGTWRDHKTFYCLAKKH